IMVLFSPIPGQEEKNADFLVSRQAAVRVDAVSELAAVTQRLLFDRALRQDLFNQLARYARPRAADHIAESIAAASCLAA
ncbi:MAG TPA: hypothetical protein VMU17_00500, partial [Elusimicrobiota bacterium]|nr:hypothetical protein [Elusimicrobiota bacterium]